MAIYLSMSYRIIESSALDSGIAQVVAEIDANNKSIILYVYQMNGP